MSAHTFTPSVVLDRVSFAWQDGSSALADLSGAFGARRTGLVGRNGSGKSTLLRLIAGELTPTSGHITTSADVAYLPQRLTLDVDRPVAELLGVAGPLAALRAIESGDVDPRHFDVVGSEWDIESRAHAALAEAGLAPGMLDRRVGALSGGEAVLTAIAGIRLGAPSITLLDEPTNNLDRDARARLADMVRGWRGTLVVVSHDVSLLDLMDETAELYDDELSVFGGPYSAWRARLDSEQEAARRATEIRELLESSATALRNKDFARAREHAERALALEPNASAPKDLIARIATAAALALADKDDDTVRLDPAKADPDDTAVIAPTAETRSPGKALSSKVAARLRTLFQSRPAKSAEAGVAAHRDRHRKEA